MELKEAYTIAQAAQASPYCEKRIRTACMSGELGYIDGKKWIIPAQEFREWMAAKSAESKANGWKQRAQR